MELQVKNSNDKPIHALVTGVGAIIGYGIIKSLRQSGLPIYIVGMDIYEDAVGQHWCDKFIQAKYAIDPNYTGAGGWTFGWTPCPGAPISWPTPPISAVF